MSQLRYLTAGESHGRALVGILEGMVAGLALTPSDVEDQLARRRHGFGRSGRQRKEQDTVEWLSGVRFGKTTGSPIALLLPNVEAEQWQEIMAAFGPETRQRAVTAPRPGHADFAGGHKYGGHQRQHTDLRNVLERASARETAMRTALGAIARRLLFELGVRITSRVVMIGGVWDKTDPWHEPLPIVEKRTDAAAVRAADPAADAAMVERIRLAMHNRESLGGVFEVRVRGLPVGLGSHTHWDRRLDGLLAQALCSIPGIKAVSIGDGAESAAQVGSAIQDGFSNARGQRLTNHAGGLEGGMTNGEDLWFTASMKPIPTLAKPLPSFDWQSSEGCEAHGERADSAAVPAAGVIGEAVTALVVANAYLEKLGGDHLDDLLARKRTLHFTRGEDHG